MPDKVVFQAVLRWIPVRPLRFSVKKRNLTPRWGIFYAEISQLIQFKIGPLAPKEFQRDSMNGLGKKSWAKKECGTRVSFLGILAESVVNLKREQVLHSCDCLIADPIYIIRRYSLTKNGPKKKDTANNWPKYIKTSASPARLSKITHDQSCTKCLSYFPPWSFQSAWVAIILPPRLPRTISPKSRLPLCIYANARGVRAPATATDIFLFAALCKLNAHKSAAISGADRYRGGLPIRGIIICYHGRHTFADNVQQRRSSAFRRHPLLDTPRRQYSGSAPVRYLINIAYSRVRHVFAGGNNIWTLDRYRVQAACIIADSRHVSHSRANGAWIVRRGCSAAIEYKNVSIP